MPFGEYVPLRRSFEPIAASSLPPADQVPGRGRRGHRHRPTVRWRSWSAGRCSSPGGSARACAPAVRWCSTPPTAPATGSPRCRPSRLRRRSCGPWRAGRWLVQVSPTGFSAFVDPDGGVHQRTGVSERAVSRAPSIATTPRLPAQALGATPALLLAALAVIAAQLWLRDPTQPDDPGAGSRRQRPITPRTIRVTGPSLTSSTAMSARNRPVCDTGAERRRRSTTTASTRAPRPSPGRAAATNEGRRPLPRVAVERELAHHEHARPARRARPCPPGIRSWHPTSPRGTPAACQILSAIRSASGTCVVVGHTHQNQQSRADPADHLSDGPVRAPMPTHPLHQGSHLPHWSTARSSRSPCGTTHRRRHAALDPVPPTAATLVRHVTPPPTHSHLRAGRRTPGPDDPLRIAYLTYRGKPHVGGQGVYTRHLTKALADLGHHVEVLSGPAVPGARPTGAAGGAAESRHLQRLLPDAHAGDLGAQGPLGLARGHRLLHRHLPRAPRVLHAGLGPPPPPCRTTSTWSRTTSASGTACWPWSARGCRCSARSTTRSPWTGASRWSTPRHPGPAVGKARWYAFTKMQTRVASRLRRVITVSKNSYDDILEDHMVSPERLFIVPVGVDPELFTPHAPTWSDARTRSSRPPPPTWR